MRLTKLVSVDSSRFRKFLSMKGFDPSIPCFTQVFLDVRIYNYVQATDYVKLYATRGSVSDTLAGKKLKRKKKSSPRKLVEKEAYLRVQLPAFD